MTNNDKRRKTRQNESWNAFENMSKHMSDKFVDAFAAIHICAVSSDIFSSKFAERKSFQDKYV